MKRFPSESHQRKRANSPGRHPLFANFTPPARLNSEPPLSRPKAPGKAGPTGVLDQVPRKVPTSMAKGTRLEEKDPNNIHEGPKPPGPNHEAGVLVRACWPRSAVVCPARCPPPVGAQSFQKANESMSLYLFRRMDVRLARIYCTGTGLMVTVYFVLVNLSDRRKWREEASRTLATTNGDKRQDDAQIQRGIVYY